MASTLVGFVSVRSDVLNTIMLIKYVGTGNLVALRILYKCPRSLNSPELSHSRLLLPFVVVLSAIRKTTTNGSSAHPGYPVNILNGIEHLEGRSCLYSGVDAQNVSGTSGDYK